MNVTTISQLRKNTKEYFDKVIDDRDILVIARSNGQSIVAMALEKYNSMAETDYLNSNPANRRHLQTGMAQARTGKGTKKTIEELHQYE